jgi:hypothetical protein
MLSKKGWWEMTKCDLRKGEIVQINMTPDAVDDIFCGSLMIVTEPRSWGAQGYVQIPGKGQAYYRATWDRMEPTNGKAVFMVEAPDEA